MVSNDTVATPVVDRNGKHTTVHKSTGKTAPVGRVVSVGAPTPAVEVDPALVAATKTIDGIVNDAQEAEESIKKKIDSINYLYGDGKAIGSDEVENLAEAAVRSHQAAILLDVIGKLRENCVDDLQVKEELEGYTFEQVDRYSPRRSTSAIANSMSVIEHEFWQNASRRARGKSLVKL